MSYVGKVETIFQANSNEPLPRAGLCVKFTSGSEDLIFVLPCQRPKTSVTQPIVSC